MKLGRSQEKVLNYIKENRGCTTKQVGEALYESVSSCANWENTIWSKEKIRHHWARGIVRALIKKRLVIETNDGTLVS